MLKKAIRRYHIYEIIRDSKEITIEKSNTKKIITALMQGDKKIEEFCYEKVKEERKEVEEAKIGKHYHKGVPKREILVNEISQYFYWLTLLTIAQKKTYRESKIENIICTILEEIDIRKIGEEKAITLEEVINHDLNQMNKKDYLQEVMKNDNSFY